MHTGLKILAVLVTLVGCADCQLSTSSTLGGSGGFSTSSTLGGSGGGSTSSTLGGSGGVSSSSVLGGSVFTSSTTSSVTSSSTSVTSSSTSSFFASSTWGFSSSYSSSSSQTNPSYGSIVMSSSGQYNLWPTAAATSGSLPPFGTKPPGTEPPPISAPAINATYVIGESSSLFAESYPFAFGDILDYSARSRVAIYSVKFGRPLFVHRDCGPSPICSFTTPFFATCCPVSGCLNGERLNISSNPPGCRCSFDPKYPCINITSENSTFTIAGTRLNVVNPTGTGPLHYLIPIENICGSFMVHVDSLKGDFDLAAVVLYGAHSRSGMADQGSYGTTMFVCAFNNSTRWNTLSLYDRYNKPATWVLIRVRPKASGTARVEIRLAPLTGRFVLPVNRYSDVVRDILPFECAGPDNETLPYLLVPLPPHPDPLLYYYAQRTGVLGEVDPATLPNDEFTFALILAESSAFGTKQWQIDPLQCTLDTWFLYDSSSKKRQTPTTPPILTFEPRPLPDCDPALFDMLSARLEEAANAYDSVLPTTPEEVIRMFATADALSKSASWQACVNWARTGPLIASTAPGTPVMSSACYAVPFTAEYASDPCCNRSLEYYQCCSPREVTPEVTSGTPNENYLSTCRTPTCSRNTAQDLLNAANPAVGACDAVYLGLFEDPDLTVNPNADEVAICFQSLTGPSCTADDDCPAGGWSCNIDWGYCVSAFNVSRSIPCLMEQTPSKILTDILFQIGQTGTETRAEQEAALTAAISTPGCAVNVVRYDGTSPATIASNETECLEHGFYCNWDTFPLSPPIRRFYGSDVARENRTWTDFCENIPWLTSHFCARTCTPDGACFETSTFNTCFDFSLDPAQCAAANGNWTPTLPQYFNRNKIPEHGCNFLAANQSDCVNTYNGQWLFYPGVLTLDTQASCEAWGTCSIPTISTREECLNFTQCTFPCDPPSCTQNDTYCETAGVCSDSLELQPSGTCLLPPPLNVLGEPMSCYASFEQYPPFAAAIGLDTTGAYYVQDATIGCVWYMFSSERQQVSVNESICTQFGGTFRYPAANRTACLAAMGCRTKQSFSFKNESECSRCSDGRMEQLYTWNAGSPTWTPYRWLPRRTLQGNKYSTSVVDPSKFRALKNPTFFRLASQAAKTAALCKYQALVTPLALLACDCIDREPDCYQQSRPSFLAITRMCSFANRTHQSTPVTLQSSSATLLTVAGAVGCTDIQIEVMTASRFFQPKTTIYSSLFLDSISTASNAVVRNNKNIIVGALLGDGAVLTYDGSATNLVLCVDIDTSLSDGDYSVYDFASINTETYSVKSFRPRYADVARDDTVTPPRLCTVLSSTATRTEAYFPIRRLSNARKATFRDTLSNKQQTAFFVAAALYMVCLLWTTFRLVNIFLWTSMSREQGKFYLQKILLVLLFVFFLLRSLYFMLVPFGEMRKAPLVIDLLMAELPTYVFFTIFTLMVLWWIELYHNATALQTSLLGRLKWAFIGINVFLYVFLIVVISVYATRVDKSSAEVCKSTPKRDQVAVILTKVYKSIVSAIALLLALGFIIYGSILVRRMTGLTHGAREKLIKFALVAVACTIGLLLQCALLLYSTFKSSDSPTPIVLAIVLVLIVELLPGGILLATIRQPRAHGVETWWQDFIWCAYMKSRGRTSSGGSGIGRRTSATTEQSVPRSTISESGPGVSKF